MYFFQLFLILCFLLFIFLKTFFFNIIFNLNFFVLLHSIFFILSFHSFRKLSTTRFFIIAKERKIHSFHIFMKMNFHFFFTFQAFNFHRIHTQKKIISVGTFFAFDNRQVPIQCEYIIYIYLYIGNTKGKNCIISYFYLFTFYFSFNSFFYSFHYSFSLFGSLTFFQKKKFGF